MAILEAKGLTVDIPTEDGTVHAVRNVSFAIRPGSLFGIAGESGSGKSVLTQAVMGLLPNADISGEVWFEGRNLIGLSQEEMRRLRGGRIGMIFQDPLSSLHPFYTIGAQIAEVLHAHETIGPAEARARVVDMLGKVGIPAPAERFDDYPHQFSGGMRQRVLIAMALIGRPELLIADEPTTALDVSVQAQILRLIHELVREYNLAALLITHNLGVVAQVCSHVAVMYAGTIVERGDVRAVFRNRVHPYTRALLDAVPRADSPRGTLRGLPGSVPNLFEPPPGCRLAPRCPQAQERCTEAMPAETTVSAGHRAACVLARPGASAP